jgi:ribosomal protein L44E
MKTACLSACLLLATLCGGCGVETATTAATAAEIKKRELEAGQRNLEQVRQKAEQAAQQVQQRAEKSDAEK